MKHSLVTTATPYQASLATLLWINLSSGILRLARIALTCSWDTITVLVCPGRRELVQLPDIGLSASGRVRPLLLSSIVLGT